MDKPICRMCGKPRNQSNLVKITPQVAFQIDYHCRISLFEDKTLPNKICFDCNYAISNFATYSETCKEVQLRMMMENDLHDIKVEIQELPVINEAPPNKESKKRKLQYDACVIADENKVKKDEDKVEKDEADDPEENGEDFENSGSDWKDSDNSSDSDYQTLAYKKRKKEKAASSPRPSRRGRKPTKAKPMDVEDPNEAIELDIPDCDKNDDGTISNNAGASYDGKKWSDRRLSCMECESVVYKGPYDLRGNLLCNQFVLINHLVFAEHYSKEHPPQFEGFEKYRCEQCGDSDEAVVECLHKFVNHICEHQPFLKFCCLVCSEMYWNLDALHQHYEIAHEESNLHFCLLCGRFFKTAYYLASHETRLHKVQISREDGEIKMPHQQAWTVENLFADEISGDLFEKQNIFRLPASEKNADGSVTQECRDRFADKSWKTLPMNCTQCHVKMPSGYELSEHYNELHFNAKLRNFICSDCPEQKTFFNHESYVNHVFTIHHEHLRYCCFICNDIYWNYKALHQHFRTSHDEYKCLMCLHCGKYHKCGYDLKSHKEVHVAKAAKDDEIGIFKCHICTKSYSRKVQIQRHLETHKNERCWICETCGASFKSKSSLINHYMGERRARQ